MGTEKSEKTQNVDGFVYKHVPLRTAACDGPEDANGEIPDHAACHLYQQDWGIPVLMSAEGTNELALDLRGL